jgi:opacity protein-like surface antigen
MMRNIFKVAAFFSVSLGLHAAEGAKKDKNPPKQTENNEENGRFYTGVFGGGGGFSVSNFTQSATKYSPPSEGGTLNVTALGGGRTAGVGMAGIQVGYLWPELVDKNPKRANPSSLNIGTEFEGYYLGTKLEHTLGSAPPRPATFDSTFPINGGTLLGGIALHFGMSEQKRYHLFLGGAAGTSVLTAHDATSYQILPTESGINHFNTKPTATAWTFAAQAKIGLMYDVTDHFKITGEYRFLYLTPARFTFGSTLYTGHPATTPWRVKFGNMYVNLGDLGLSYYF